ncbi:uncharacterized protein LOC143885839 [Tasmannia lanceolata]|uniref:uncharacterized protein LOC143885839 n=1 Tax=Tasmannia lanceolata TaxID=3420 RepID=UPI0040639196
MEVYIDDKLVKSLKTTNHITDLQEAFTVLRKYQMKPNLSKCAFGVTSVLMKPLPNEELYLYLAISPLAVSIVLVRQEQRTEHHIYYVSRVLHDAETRYQNIKKFAFAVVVAARKLCPYFQAHTIVVLTDQPLRKILQKPDIS